MRAAWSALIALCITAGTIFASPSFAAELSFPALSGRIVDQAGILSADTERAVTDLSANLEKSTSIQLVVATLSTLQGHPIEDIGYQLGRAWGIGRSGKNNGVLLIVAPNERSVRIEIGYGLEGTLTDAISKGIVEQQILPKFRSNDFDGGVRAGATAIAAVVSGDTALASRLSEAGSRKVRPANDAWTWIVLAPFLILFFLRMFSPFWGWRRGVGGMWFPGGGFGSGRGFGGGGFSGGGGSFGGGGASGRW